MSQTVPTFDGATIFSFPGGTCAVELTIAPYQPIVQNIHPNGKNGSVVLYHGFENRPWVAVGHIGASSQAGLHTAISAIEEYCLNSVTDPDQWYAMSDSVGNGFSESKILSVHATNTHATNGGWICQIIVQGCLKGSPKYGESAVTE